MATAGDVTNIHTVMFLLYGLISEFWGAARQVSELYYDPPMAKSLMTVPSALTCTQRYLLHSL
jgi:hypothetical protein